MLETLFTKFDLYLENEFTLGELIVFILGSLKALIYRYLVK